MKSKPRGKILRIKLGVNPNSSSIGTDMIVLLLGAGGIAALTFMISGALRLFRRNRNEKT